MPDQHFADETSVPLSALGIWRFWPLRFVLFFVVLTGAYVGCQLLAGVVPKKLPLIPADVSMAAFVLLGIAIMITIYRLLVRWTEKRGPALSMAMLAGVAEEIIFRGAIYRLLEDGFGTLIAIVLSGALFGLLHALNPGATLASTAAIAVEAGILLAAAYLVTRSLWLAIGLHIGWNFTEGGIFGAAVSGGKSHGLVSTVFAGPDWLTGGKFGPEASLTAVILCVIVAAVLLIVAIRRGEWKPLRFKLATA